MYCKNDADQIEFLSKIPEDEPIFILRASDVLAPDMISWWISQHAFRGTDRSTYTAGANALGHLASFVEWRRTHETKFPD